MRGKRALNPAFMKKAAATTDNSDDIVIAAPKKNPNIDYAAQAQANM